VNAPKDDVLAAAVAELGALPMPTGDTGPALAPDREQTIRTLDLLPLMSDTVAPVISGHLAVLLAEVDRLRAENGRWRERTEEAEVGEAQLKGRLRGLRARVAELEAATYVAPSPSCTRCYGADAVRFVANGGVTAPCRACAPSELEELRARVAELEALTPAPIQTCRSCGAGYDYGQPCSVCEFKKRMAAEIADTPAPRDVRPGAEAARRMLRGRALLDAKAAEEAEAAHWKRLGINPPASPEDPHDSPLHHTYAEGRDLPEVTP